MTEPGRQEDELLCRWVCLADGMSRSIPSPRTEVAGPLRLSLPLDLHRIERPPTQVEQSLRILNAVDGHLALKAASEGSDTLNERTALPAIPYPSKVHVSFDCVELPGLHGPSL